MEKKNIILAAAIGDISGVPYEFNPTKNYNEVDLLRTDNTYSDDTVLTFACAEALLYGKDVAECMWRRGRDDFKRGFGGRFARWLAHSEVSPAYGSYGNGSAMRVSSVGILAKSPEECIELATKTAMPTHNHPEGVKGAVATALAIYYAKKHKDKTFISKHVLEKYYPSWASKTYVEIKPEYHFDETCQLTIPAALICFLESTNFEDSLKLAISLGGDADTLGAIVAPISYAYYGTMPDPLIKNAKAKLAGWMLEILEDL